MAWASIRADDATRLSAAASGITLPELAILAWFSTLSVPAKGAEGSAMVRQLGLRQATRSRAPSPFTCSTPLLLSSIPWLMMELPDFAITCCFAARMISGPSRVAAVLLRSSTRLAPTVS